MKEHIKKIREMVNAENRYCALHSSDVLKLCESAEILMDFAEIIQAMGHDCETIKAHDTLEKVKEIWKKP